MYFLLFVFDNKTHIFCSLAFSGQQYGQLYTYPAKRWKMKQRAYQLKEAAHAAKNKEGTENGDAGTLTFL